MVRFKKAFNLKMISLLVIVAFFFNSTVYGMDLSQKTNLRVQLKTSTDKGKARFSEALSLASNQKSKRVGHASNLESSKKVKKISPIKKFGINLTLGIQIFLIGVRESVFGLIKKPLIAALLFVISLPFLTKIEILHAGVPGEYPSIIDVGKVKVSWIWEDGNKIETHQDISKDSLQIDNVKEEEGLKAYGILDGLWQEVYRTETAVIYKVKLPDGRVINVLAETHPRADIGPDQRRFLKLFKEDKSKDKLYVCEGAIDNESKNMLESTPYETLPAGRDGDIEILTQKELLRNDIIAAIFINKIALALDIYPVVVGREFDINSKIECSRLRKIVIKETARWLDLSSTEEVERAMDQFFSRDTTDAINRLIIVNQSSLNASNRLMADRLKDILSRHEGPIWIRIGSSHLLALTDKDSSPALEVFDNYNTFLSPDILEAAFRLTRRVILNSLIGVEKKSTDKADRSKKPKAEIPPSLFQVLIQDKIKGVCREVLMMLTEDEKKKITEMQRNKLKSKIEKAEENLGISGVSKYWDQVILVEKTLITVLEQEWSTPEGALDYLVEEMYCVQVKEKGKAIPSALLVVNWHLKRGDFGKYDHNNNIIRVSMSYIRHGIGIKGSAPVDEILQGFQLGYYEFPDLSSSDQERYAKWFMSSVGKIALEGFKKDFSGTIPTRSEIIEGNKIDAIHHESWHFAERALSYIPEPPYSVGGNIMGPDLLPSLYTMAKGSLPHYTLALVFKDFLKEDGWSDEARMDSPMARTPYYILTRLSEQAGLTVNFNSSSLRDLRDSYEKLTLLSKEELQDATLALLNELLGRPVKDPSILNIIQMIKAVKTQKPDIREGIIIPSGSIRSCI